MRKVILSVNVSIDGFMAGPRGELDWHFDHWNNEMSEFAYEQLRDVDTILVGRVAYESMASYWPNASQRNSVNAGEAEFAERMNVMRKIVFSQTLKDVTWNNSVLMSSNIPQQIEQLKKQKGKNMIMWGGVNIISNFVRWRLIDEYRIATAPVILGKGLSFTENLDRRSFHLQKTRIFNNGVVLNYFLPK